MTNFLVSQGAVRNGWFLDAAAIVAQSDTAAVAYEKVHPDPPRHHIWTYNPRFYSPRWHTCIRIDTG